MDKKFCQYMKYGKLVYVIETSETFKLIKDIESGDDVAIGVNTSNWDRYHLLKTWGGNHVGLTDEQCDEMLSYETKLKISEVKPHNKIRFITPDYQTKFEVTDLEEILLNGKPERVAYLDETHFTFVDRNMNFYGGCLHICQFAELCERNGITVALMPTFTAPTPEDTDI